MGGFGRELRADWSAIAWPRPLRPSAGPPGEPRGPRRRAMPRKILDVTDPWCDRDTTVTEVLPQCERESRGLDR